VAWPPVTLRLPHTSTALSDDVRLTLTVDQRVCQSQQQPRASYTLQLIYVARPGLLNASYTLQLIYVARPGLLNASYTLQLLYVASPGLLNAPRTRSSCSTSPVRACSTRRRRSSTRGH